MELRTKYRVYKYKYRSLSNNNAERDANGKIIIGESGLVEGSEVFRILLIYVALCLQYWAPKMMFFV